MFRAFAVVACVLVIAASVRAAVQTKTISYKHGNVNCEGFLAWDDSIQGPRPGVLVVHEWWGLNDYAKHRAEELAKLGYVAFCADMYGEGKSTNPPNEAGAMATKVRTNIQDWRKRAEEALEVLK